MHSKSFCYVGNDNGTDGRGGKERYGGSGRVDSDNAKNIRDFRDDKPKEFYIPPEASNDENEIFNQGITSGLNFAKYDKIPVKLTGDKPPKPIMNFHDSGLCDFLQQNIEKCGYKDPTPIQKTSIPIVLAKRDLMACAQTGSGKTAAFILPILNTLLTETVDLENTKPHVIIISPTRELARQVISRNTTFFFSLLFNLIFTDFQ